MAENNLMLQSFLMKTMNEFPADIEWVAAADFEERYQVSFYGEVKSISRVLIRKNGRPITVKGKTLSTYINKNGYVMVELHDSADDSQNLFINLYGSRFMVKCLMDLKLNIGMMTQPTTF